MSERQTSPFHSILEAFVVACPSCHAAILVDEEGEAVDWALSPTAESMTDEAAIAGAEWQLVMRDIKKRCGFEATRQLVIDSTRLSYLVRYIHGDYTLVVVGQPGILHTVSFRAIRQVEVELCLEAQWPVPNNEDLCWWRLPVRLDSGGTPCAVRIAGRWIDQVAVITPLRGLEPGDRGFEVIVAHRLPIRLVREAAGEWFAGRILPPSSRG